MFRVALTTTDAVVRTGRTVQQSLANTDVEQTARTIAIIIFFIFNNPLLNKVIKTTERTGFEPVVTIKPRRFSKPLH